MAAFPQPRLGIARIYLSEVSAFRDKWWKLMAVFGVMEVPGH